MGPNRGLNANRRLHDAIVVDPFLNCSLFVVGLLHSFEDVDRPLLHFTQSLVSSKGFQALHELLHFHR